jgi:hypothetical protein
MRIVAVRSQLHSSVAVNRSPTDTLVVCRQARKGHDRWQSQISYAGVNHYLGTFDSEWDAAAVYAVSS